MSTRKLPADQTPIFFLGRPIGAVRLFDQAPPIENDDLPPRRADQTLAFEQVQRDGDAGAAYTKHDCEEFMGQPDGHAVGAVVNHQQPTRKPFLEFRVAIGKNRRRRLRKQRLDIGEKKTAQGPAFFHRRREDTRRQFETVPGDLHERSIGGLIAAEDDGGAGHAFAADNAYLDVAPAGEPRHDRGKAGFHYVDVTDRRILRLQNLGDLKSNRLQMRQQKLTLLRTHGAQQFIAKIQLFVVHIHPRIDDHAIVVAGEPNHLESLSNALCNSVQRQSPPPRRS
ncbi:hypothetical protein RHECNPAF_14110061 [Rhizobium etli CNPAF512]|nr:hypothetical protein RHECNPAF_14110061 [Rhizobium etli CNPAF512]